MRPLLLALLVTASACATARFDSPVELDRFRGVYTTHFEGIPDRSAVCAVITNRGGIGVEWVRLRLESHSQLGEQPARWVSYWVWRGKLAPGESVALELDDPPIADQIRLNLRGASHGNAPTAGRSARRIRECSESALHVRLQRSGQRVLPVVRRNDGARDEILVASEED